MAENPSKSNSQDDAPSILRALMRGEDLELHDAVWLEISKAAKALKIHDATLADRIISSVNPTDDVQSFAHLLIRLRVSLGKYDLVMAESLANQLQQHPMMNEPPLAALARFRIGNSMAHLSRHEDAVRHFLHAIQTYRELNWTFEEAVCIVEIGNVMRAKGDLAGALRCYLSALDTIQREGEEDLYAAMLINIAGVLHVSGNTEEAERRFSQALRTSRFSRPGPERAEILVRIAFLHKSAGRIDAAQESYMEAAALTDKHQPSAMSARIESAIAELDVMRAEYTSALSRIEKIESMYSMALSLHTRLQMLCVKARALQQVGRGNEAAETLRAAISLVRESDDLEFYHIVLNDALEWVEDSSLRMGVLEEYRTVQDERMKSVAKSTAAMLDLRASFEQEQSRREISRQKDLASAIVETQQLTMNDIGRDLHDSLGQDVTVMSMLVDRLRTNPTLAYQEVLNILDTMQSVTQRVAADSRRIAHRLMSKAITARNVSNALEEVKSELSTAAPSLRIDLHISGGIETMPDEVALTFYRIAQATLKNVVRHADASTCTINLAAHDDHFHLDIEDDGKGFDPQKIREGIGMRESKARAEIIGGRARIESQPGNGTRVTVTVPKK
ncbi:MAG: tetratricopeptide repeat protein [Candidatus Kapaibacterium sp.]